MKITGVMTAVCWTSFLLAGESFDARRLFEKEPKEKEEEKKRRIEGVEDNSFLIEEAYNQEPGVVQHVVGFSFDLDRKPGKDDRTLNMTFSQEWPVLSQRHQLAYSIPYTTARSGGDTNNGLEDITVQYRYQALMESDSIPAFAPGISFILPSGRRQNGFGNDTVGYELGLPLSKVLSDRWVVHFNASAALFPRASAELDTGGRTPRRTLTNFGLGASAIFAVTSNLHVMCETVSSWDQEINGIGRRERSFSAVISPGFRYGISLPKAKNAQLVFGVGVPIGLTKSAPDFGVLGYFSFEHSF